MTRSTHSLAKRRIVATVAVVVAATVGAACSSPSSAAPGGVGGAAVGDESATDVDSTVGGLGPNTVGDGSTPPWAQAPQDYENEPLPAESVVATLCNLNMERLSELADLAEADDGAELQLAVVALGDQVTEWHTVVGHFPEAADDVGVAEQVLDLWYSALGDSDGGNAAAMQQKLGQARAAIDKLPNADEVDVVDCAG